MLLPFSELLSFACKHHFHRKPSSCRHHRRRGHLHPRLRRRYPRLPCRRSPSCVAARPSAAAPPARQAFASRMRLVCAHAIPARTVLRTCSRAIPRSRLQCAATRSQPEDAKRSWPRENARSSRFKPSNARPCATPAIWLHASSSVRVRIWARNSAPPVSLPSTVCGGNCFSRQSPRMRLAGSASNA